MLGRPSVLRNPLLTARRSVQSFSTNKNSRPSLSFSVSEDDRLHTPKGSFWKSSRESLTTILENNKKWRTEALKDPEFAAKMQSEQKPRYLWIGCSDSRVPAEDITGLNPGEMFVHRNIANLVVNNDVNLLSVVQYAVENLKVQDIIVAGHYGCGGVQAAMQNKDLGLLDNWLRNIRDVARLHYDELALISDEEQRLRRMVELNVTEQCINIFKIGLVQRHQAKYGIPHIHGLVYDMGSGKLNRLDIDFASYITRYRSIYKLDAFDHLEMERPALQAHMIEYLARDHEEESGRISRKYMKYAMTRETELFTMDEIEDGFASVHVDEAGTIDVDELRDFFLSNKA